VTDASVSVATKLVASLKAVTVKFDKWRRSEIPLSEGKSSMRIQQVRDEVPTEQF